MYINECLMKCLGYSRICTAGFIGNQHTLLHLILTWFRKEGEERRSLNIRPLAHEAPSKPLGPLNIISIWLISLFISKYQRSWRQVEVGILAKINDLNNSKKGIQLLSRFLKSTRRAEITKKLMLFMAMYS